MKRKKDISDLIRDNQHKLNERPSPRTWQRLESKLDNQRSRHRTSIYKQFAMVAAVIALVAVASLISITVNTQQTASKMAKADYSPMSLPVQELETVYTDANEDLQQVVEFQRSLKRIYASNPNPIAEGSQNKKVIVTNELKKNNNTITPQQINKNALALNDVKNSKPLAKPQIAKTQEILEDESFPESDDAIVSINEESTTADIVNQDVIASNEANAISSKVSESKNDKTENVMSETSSPVASVVSPPAAVEMARERKKVNNLWYLGTWSYDKNLKKNEKLKIVQTGNDIQLVVSIENSKDIFYNFVSENNNIVTFENAFSKERYNIRIENGKYVIYKNNQDYGLLIEKEE